MHILVTGINGLLGQNLVKEFSPDHRVSGIDISPSIYEIDQNIAVAKIDLTNIIALRDHLKSMAPDVIIHTAAYTNVDRAEVESDLAYSINALVPGELAKACGEMDIPYIHISTDYVFNGEAGPYRELDPQDPRGSYSKSKHAGEMAAVKNGGKVAVIRPNVMYGFGQNLKSSFVDWLIGELRQGKSVNIVDDQYNNPTYARRLASVTRVIINKEAWGIWHFGSKEVISRYTFALKVADSFGLPSELISAISTGDLNQLAPRPMRSGLICEKLQKELEIPILSIGEELALLKEEMDAS